MTGSDFSEDELPAVSQVKNRDKELLIYHVDSSIIHSNFSNFSTLQNKSTSNANKEFKIYYQNTRGNYLTNTYFQFSVTINLANKHF